MSLGGLGTSLHTMAGPKPTLLCPHWVMVGSDKFCYLQASSSSSVSVPQPVLPMAGVVPLLCHSPPLDSSHCFGSPKLCFPLHKCVCSSAQMWHLTLGHFSQRQLWVHFCSRAAQSQHQWGGLQGQSRFASQRAFHSQMGFCEVEEEKQLIG